MFNNDAFKNLAKTVVPGSFRKKIRDSLTKYREIKYPKTIVKTYLNEQSDPKESFSSFFDFEAQQSINISEKLYESDIKFLGRMISKCITSKSSDDCSEQHIETWVFKPKEAIEELQKGINALGYDHNFLQISLESPNPSDKLESFEDALWKFFDRLINYQNFAPRFYELDFMDDIENIILSRYCNGKKESLSKGQLIIDVLKIFFACSEKPISDLQKRTKQYLNSGYSWAPLRGGATSYVKDVIPDLFEEFCSCHGSKTPERFLEINKEYSIRQRNEIGATDSRQLSLFRQYERDHLVLLRSLLRLIRLGKITTKDSVLIIGPRHDDEIIFFREILGLKNTIGLDLFGNESGSIIAGDMHRMPFQDKKFKFVFMCNTLTYAYNAREVISEISRVVCLDGYAMIIDSGSRVRGPDPLGRSDVVNVDTLIRCFYKRDYTVIVADKGRSLAPENYTEQPCCLIQLNSFH